MPPHKIRFPFPSRAANYLIGKVTAVTGPAEWTVTIAVGSPGHEPCSATTNNINSFQRWLRPKMRAVASGQVRERPQYSWQCSATILPSLSGAHSWVAPAPAPQFDFKSE
jgi:hypothetical protein